MGPAVCGVPGIGVLTVEPWRELGFDSLEAFQQEIGGHLQDIVSSEEARSARLTNEERTLYRVARKSLTLLQLLATRAPELLLTTQIEALRKACVEHQADRN